jgi:hypothetical protein
MRRSPPNAATRSARARDRDGELRAPAVEVYPLDSARGAFTRSLERGPHGKVVLGIG